MTITERQVLKPGTSLSLDGRKCMILGVMGAGTSCIAYKAQMKITIKDQTALRTIVLKELYPAHQNISRGKDNSLIIPENSKALFEEESESFVNAAVLQFEFHNEEDLTNFTSDIEVVYELNNTLYSVTGIVSGKSYDKIKPENTTDILKVGESLSHAISYYHERDYLNLDIKPSNIFYENLPGDNVAIKLFDFNTVCTKEEASQGKFSYSDGYAAPEVKAAKKGSGKLSEVGEQADIYSIGAVIFEKIMGRIPKVADQRAGKRWKLESNLYLKDAVPQLQKGITKLFRKTLAIDRKDRYSSVKELISDLEKLINLAGIKVFLKNQRISPCTPKDIYISRKDILSKISKALDEKHILYLHALGGSGKSETAREYAEQYADKYDFIQSVFYSGNLKKTIANLDFVGLKDEDRFAHTDEDIDRLYNYKYGLLGNSDIYKANTLLIIDNYNPTSDEVIQNQEIISKLRDLHIHILFTTRVKPTDISECFDLENMFPEELRALFFRINPTDKDKSERIKLVDEIIKLSYNHTMTVKLVAMQSAEYMKPLEEYRKVLQEKGLNSGFESEIINEKDGRLVVEDSVYNHIRALFKLNDLKPKQKYIMVNACLLPLSGLEAATFSKYIDLAHFESSSSSVFLDPEIKKLVNSGWIEYADTSEKRFTAETKITLHPLICDIVKNELKPELTEDKCRKFYVSFLDLIQEWGNNKVSGNNAEYQNEIVYSLFSKFVMFQNKNIQKMRQVINYIFISKKEFDIQNHSILYGDTLYMYFGIDQKHIIKGNIKKLHFGSFVNCECSEITIPNSITEIEGRTFAKCASLTNIDISNHVTKIENGVFEDCTALTQVAISDSVKEIGCHAFQSCHSLTRIIIPNSVTKIGYYAFSECISLTNIHIPNNVNEIENGVFRDCTALTQVIIPDSVTKIGPDAFANCTALTQVAIPDSVKEIGYRAFANCTALTSISIPNSLKIIGDNVFEGCISLSKITMSDTLINNLINIGEKIFDGCVSLSESKISEQLEKKRMKLNYYKPYSQKLYEQEVKKRMFFPKKNVGFKADKSLHIIPNGLKVIGDSYFKNCKSLIKVTIPDGVKEIGWSAFENCSSLSEINIPNSVTEINYRAFVNCTSITQINLPDCVTYIGEAAFENCSSLVKINIPDNTKIRKCEFKNLFNYLLFLLKLFITKLRYTTIKQATFRNCFSLTQMIIPNSITDIEYAAFENCFSLKKITFLNPKTHIHELSIGYCINSDGLYIKNRELTIEGYKNSTAEQYAQEHGFKFVPLD